MGSILFHGARKPLTKAEAEACRDPGVGGPNCRKHHAGFVCTRHKNHTGVHVAATRAKMVVCVWTEIAYPEEEPTESPQQMVDRISLNCSLDPDMVRVVLREAGIDVDTGWQEGGHDDNA